MKNLLQPKYILLFIFCVAAFFLLRKQFEGSHDVLIAGDQSNALCPVHHTKLRLDTVGIYIRKDEPDSAYFALQRRSFPLALDTFYLLEWFQDDEHKGLTRAQVWYCPACRAAKKLFEQGQS
ncbi:MAG: hypothetical protein Q8916_04880 [Bacteroidota bacterium]|nr:hypothetical protein [Bacteroidota bacterium]MDP4229722.1 hypothetical protein [Bacteroidota bacterium]MDP4235777.1 hypothetical protein [Bacteroidota bacterium]